MTLYLKHRPNNLDDIKGNASEIASLKRMLENVETCPHSFLFTGPTGCGKTTIARIVANELGAVGNDFRELNTADFRGIDSVREMRKQSQYKPLEGRCRVWIIDECHKLTNDAQNSMLKLLEDTPKHVYFILCTTDPQKLLKTIKNRCTQIQVTPLSDRQMTSLLVRTVKAEKESLDKVVYDSIVRDSFGLPRNALQILDKVLLAPAENRLTTAEQSAEAESQSIELCRALINNAPWSKIKVILNGLKDQDAEGIRRHVLGYCQSGRGRDSSSCFGLLSICFTER